MHLPIELLIFFGWIVFLTFWALNAQRVKSTARNESSAARFFKYWLPLIVAVVLVQPIEGMQDSLIRLRFVPPTDWLPLLGVLLVWAGVLFCCWARVVLGRNWSAVVQVKQDHELIVRGPYRWVRHPIYTGLLMAFLGTGLAIGEWRALLAVVIVAGSFWIKLRLEERWMREHFGEAYVAYMARVKALIPGVL